MTDNPYSISERFPLPGWRIVEASGRDAAAFLHAQTMNDVNALAMGHWQWNGWLNPKGRLIALFALLALDAERYWLVVPDFPAAEFVNRLQRFVFRSKVTLRVRDDCAVFGAFALPEQARDSAIHHAQESGDVELDFGADDGARTLRIVAATDATTTTSDADETRWDAFDLAHGLPRLSMDQSEEWTPQMLSLDRLNAYSLKKGCYPGQEIVARTHYLGQAKRGLARIAGNQLMVGAEVVADGKTLGTLVSSIGDEALAVLSVDRPIAGLKSPCHELPLLGGLAR